MGLIEDLGEILGEIVADVEIAYVDFDELEVDL